MHPEARKTFTFILVAAMAVLVAWEPWRPAPASNSVPDEVGTRLFPKFNDPLAAKSLEVVKYDEDSSTISDFKVAQTNGVWAIPSHNDYPADAKEHMAQAATALLDLKILGVASTNAGDQQLYGVITPDPQKLTAGAQGVGTRITLKGDKDAVLADVVIGKDVKDQPTLRYVRRADKDQIYKVEVRTDKFSTKFEDWIEKDLLKLNAFDVREVDLKDYSTQAGANRGGGIAIGISERFHAKLGFDDAKSNWNAIELTTFDEKGQPSPTKLGEDEELNSEKLNAMKTALDDLKIVDVERKPTGLGRDLRATEEFTKNVEAMQSLFSRGFYPVQREGHNEILSTEGEATCTTKDGVRYVLRFGNLASSLPAAKDDGEKPDEPKSNPALNRYLFVMAQLDESQIPKPQLEEVPGEDEPAAAKDDKPAEEKPPAKADEKSGDAAPETKTADDETPAPKAKKNSKKKSTPKAKAAEAKTAGEEPKAAAVDNDPPPDLAKETAGDAAKKVDEPKAEAPQGDAPAVEKKDDKPATPAEVQRIAIQRENKRKEDEYAAALKKGQEKVTELNERFADWYFVIPDDVYKKIHLGKDDIVRKKEATAEGDKPAGDKVPGIGDLQQLQQGLKGK